jgi:transposase
MKITTVGIDFARNVFQVHGVDECGKAVLKKQLKRHQVLGVFSNMPPGLIGMEACGGGHCWARRLQAQGHTVRLMAPPFVKPYVKGNKHDAADAEAICEAVTRPTMRFVPIKNIEQQAMLSLHRARRGFVGERTALANRIRGLVVEFGLIIPQGIHHITRRVPEILEDASNELSDPMRALLARLLEHLQELQRQTKELETEIIQWHRHHELSRKLEAIPGIGPLTASALATVGDAKNFRNGRQLAAWLGLVPKQESSGGKTVLPGISERGDAYLRTLLIHGARAVLWAAQRQGIRGPMGTGAARAAQHQRRGGGDGEHERGHRLGAAGKGPAVRPGLRAHARGGITRHGGISSERFHSRANRNLDCSGEQSRDGKTRQTVVGKTRL